MFAYLDNLFDLSANKEIGTNFVPIFVCNIAFLFAVENILDCVETQNFASIHKRCLFFCSRAMARLYIE